MAAALIGGVIGAGAAEAADITATDISAERLQFVSQKYGIHISQNNAAAAKTADILFIVVKPAQVIEILQEIKPAIRPETIVLNIAAGITLGTMQTQLAGATAKLVNTMPNTPAMVNEGVTAVCATQHITDADMEAVKKLLNAVGKVVVLPESQFAAFTGLAGSSPAYAYMFIEAMADAGVKNGLPREQAIRMSAQAVMGAAKMVLETGEHPAALKDAVCSPGGTTIEAVCELEKHGLRNAVISAVNAAAKKYNQVR
jgi:pyrroline-5-carboxylate reductase